MADDDTHTKRHQTVNRRRFMEAAGAAGVVATTGLAGCLGGGDGGDGSDGSDGGSEERQTVSLTTVPVGLPQGIVVQHWQDTDILANTFEARGYDLEFRQTFEDATLFAAGQSDLSNVSTIEAARLAVEQDMDLVVFGGVLSVVHGMYVATGSPYDPDEAGSVQAAVDRIVDDQAQVGIQSWASGNIPLQQRIFREVFGYEFTQEGGDFNVFTTDYGTMPQLIKDGELAMGSNTPIVAGIADLVAGDIKSLFYVRNVYAEQGWGNPPLNNLTTTREFYESEPGAVLACLNAWGQSTEWLHENADEIAGSQSGREALNMANEEQARYLLDLYVTLDGAIDYETIPRDPGFTADEIDKATTFLEGAEEVGQIPSGWQDGVEFLTPDDIEAQV